ncbi:hypothetical protein [Sphingobium yanoikuyae]|uniref:hypothetical protein n=1 Tax=Sphingobium yanoikuyae TaxID=13690 RepID=UPI0035C6A59C
MFGLFNKRPTHQPAEESTTVSKSYHDRVVMEKNGEIRRHLQRIDGQFHEIGQLKAQAAGILRDKIAESERANLAEQRVNSLLAEIAALRPDAEKYRERCRRDREHAANKRKRAA